MLEVLTDFVEELRRQGLPVSPKETMDAGAALRAVGIGERDAVRATLAATLLKSHEHAAAFARTFDVFFAITLAESAVTSDAPLVTSATRGLGEDGVALDPATLRALVRAALASGDRLALRRVARQSVALLSGIEAGRPVGISYYLYRTMRTLDLESLVSEMGASQLGAIALPTGELGTRLFEEELAARAATFRALVEEAITESLVADRGAEAIMSSQRRTALGEVDFMHATQGELAAIRRALGPLARRLAARLARRRRVGHRGAIDLRATIHRSLSTGGVPLEPRFVVPHPKKPELVVIADVSGSVASFARFTIQLVFAIASQFAKVRSFVFIDEIDEVSAIFRKSASLREAIGRVAAEAKVTDREGHSNYGNALQAFTDRYANELGARTDVLIFGDARNNYHPARAELLGAIANRARHVYWLNPEPRAYWGSGDSIIALYAPHCDGVYECRNLDQLEEFVSSLPERAESRAHRTTRVRS